MLYEVITRNEKKPSIRRFLSEIEGAQIRFFEGRGTGERIGVQGSGQFLHAARPLRLAEQTADPFKGAARDKTYPIYHVCREQGNPFEDRRRKRKAEGAGHHHPLQRVGVDAGAPQQTLRSGPNRPLGELEAADLLLREQQVDGGGAVEAQGPPLRGLSYNFV